MVVLMCISWAAKQRGKSTLKYPFSHSSTYIISFLTPYDELINHYSEVIMTTMASQITSLAVVYSTVCSDADQRTHQSSASLAFVWGSHRDRWIPRTKGQLRGKCFHLMTSSCHAQEFHTVIDIVPHFVCLCFGDDVTIDCARLMITSQLIVQHTVWLDNCDAITWKVIPNSSDIDSIHDNMHVQSGKQSLQLNCISGKHLNYVLLFRCRDHFVYAPSQWQTTLQCNVASHWLGTYTKLSLQMAMEGRRLSSSLPLAITMVERFVALHGHVH